MGNYTKVSNVLHIPSIYYLLETSFGVFGSQSSKKKLETYASEFRGKGRNIIKKKVQHFDCPVPVTAIEWLK
jgi:hypothetical protein